MQKVKNEKQNSINKYKGFLYIKCEHCGSEIGYCAKREQDHMLCRCCGNKTYFKEPLKWMRVTCECGGNFSYKTNMEEKLFDIRCLDCGMPVTEIYNEKKHAYVTYRQ